ncbi:MAG: DUF2334 domain-containing protein [Lachnospiraceae bacterium]|nr:DUF2334 domain-containing protein [Lachnospiraceae bacterium]
MNISIRMDDITPDMDWAKFLRFKELCDLYQVKPLIGVVPENQDSMLHIDEERDDFWECLLQLEKEGWVIAQHGYTHIYSTKKKGCFPLNAISEYAGKPYEEQLANLKKGKQILESHGIYTDIFMAPAHSYDKNTLKALKEVGFSKLTDGFGDRPYEWKGLTFYPISFKQSNSLKQEKGYTTFVIHANTMNEKDFERYEKLFAEHKDKLISYQDYLKVSTEKRGVIGRVKEYLMAISKYVLVRVNSLRK